MLNPHPSNVALFQAGLRIPPSFLLLLLPPPVCVRNLLKCSCSPQEAHRTSEQTNKDAQSGIQKNEPSYENTNFSLWTEPLWFLISPMIAAFPHQIGQRPPPSHFRVFSEGRVLLFIKRSEVSALSFLRLRRISAAFLPLPSIYRSLHLDLIAHPLSAM